MISTPAFRPPLVSLLASLWLTGPLHWPRAELVLNVLCFTSVHVSCGARCFDRLWTLTFASAPAVAGRILTCWPSHFAYRLSCWLVRPWDKGSINGKSLLESGFLHSAQLSACGCPCYSHNLYRRSLLVTDLYRRFLLHSVLEGRPVAGATQHNTTLHNTTQCNAT